MDGIDVRTIVQNIFNVTHCYDIMPESNKIVVFETMIAFQLAFFALIEHDTEIAPLWCPEKRAVVGLISVYDYIRAIVSGRDRGSSLALLNAKTINDIISAPLTFGQAESESVDCEDSVFQLYMSLERSNADFAWVENPDDGQLVSVLGFVDILGLLYAASKQQPDLFAYSIQNILNLPGRDPTMTAPSGTKLIDVLRAIEERSLAAVPVIDANTHAVLGLYHRNDVTFILRANQENPESVIQNLVSMMVGEVILPNNPTSPSSSSSNPNNNNSSSSSSSSSVASDPMLSYRQIPMVKCVPSDSLPSLIERMLESRVTSAVCVNEFNRCLGVITVKDILRLYFEDNNNGGGR